MRWPITAAMMLLKGICRCHNGKMDKARWFYLTNRFKKMSEDLISNNFSDTVNKNTIQHNIRLLWIVLVLFSVYIIFEIIEWTLFLSSMKDAKSSAFTLYNYKIMPVIVAANFVIGILIWFFYIKAHRLILLSFQKDNADIFNKGYSLLNRASTLNIIGYTLIIVSIILRFILKYSS